MNPPPDLYDDLSAIAEHGSRTLRPRPVDDVIRRGRQRTRRQRVATGALALVAVAGAIVAVQVSRPAAPVDLPAAGPTVSSPSPTIAPVPTVGATTSVGLQMADGSDSLIVAGSDDDDRVLVDIGQTKQYPGEDNAARGRWVLRPNGDGFAIAQEVARPNGKVCMARETDGQLRIRMCRAGAAAQKFTLTATEDQQAYALSWNGKPVRVGDDSDLVTSGDGPAVRLQIKPVS